MISNLAVVAVCTDHEDQTKKVEMRKKTNNNVKDDLCPGFHTFGKAEPPKRAGRIRGVCRKRVCARLIHLSIFST